MKHVNVLDNTLRDGSHATGFMAADTCSEPMRGFLPGVPA